MKTDKYPWTPIDNQWQHILMSPSYFIKNTPADGNCQFHSLKIPLNISHSKLRKMIANYILTINDTQFQDILNIYKAEQNNGEFQGNWNPQSINTKRQLASHIKKTGFHFQGDYITLSILSTILNTDFYILHQNTHTITKIENNNTNFIILHFTQMNNTGHYQTIGFQNDTSVQTFFNKQQLHPDISPLINKELFFTKHIKQIYKSNIQFTCNNLISNLQTTLGNLTQTDKNLICKLSAKLINKPSKTKKILKHKIKKIKKLSTKNKHKNN